MRGAIIIIMVSYCASFFCQDADYSRNFEASRKNVPMAIYNWHPDYFYVLRFNKLAHDLVVEKRGKPASDLISFFPLKLDQVNAGWFDYENLDHVFFEKAGRLFFVFEKVLNNRKTIYYKELGLSESEGGFREITSLERDADLLDFRFHFSLSFDQQILIIAEKRFQDHSVRKTAMLYDCAERRKIWQKPLPNENPATGYSRAHTAAPGKRLYYVQVKSRVAGYKRQYQNHMQTLVPFWYHDSLKLVEYPENIANLQQQQLCVQEIQQLNTLSVLADDSMVLISSHFSKAVEGEAAKVYFLNQAFKTGLDSILYCTISPLDKSLAEQLNFFDGNDLASVSDKDYRLYARHVSGNHLYFTSERKESGFDKELLFWRVGKKDGQVKTQVILPRKIQFFSGRSRFRYIGEPAIVVRDSVQLTVLLENRNNENLNAGDFVYRDFARLRGSSGASVMLYISCPGQPVRKKLLFRNGDYEYVPLRFYSSQDDFVLYQAKGKLERFVIWRVNLP